MTTQIESKAREFRSDDWNGFAGCENWDNNSSPVLRELRRYLVVADKNGVCLYESVGDETRWFSLRIEFPNQSLALFFLNALPHSLSEAIATQLGFTDEGII